MNLCNFNYNNITNNNIKPEKSMIRLYQLIHLIYTNILLQIYHNKPGNANAPQIY